MATTYNNLYLDIRQRLRAAGIESATLEARELVCFGTGKSREELARSGGLYASPELEQRVQKLVDRHLAGEPVAYLIGEWEFYGLPLDISPDRHRGVGGRGCEVPPGTGGVPGFGLVFWQWLYRISPCQPGFPGQGGAGGVF